MDAPHVLRESTQLLALLHVVLPSRVVPLAIVGLQDHVLAQQALRVLLHMMQAQAQQEDALYVLTVLTVRQEMVIRVLALLVLWDSTARMVR